MTLSDPAEAAGIADAAHVGTIVIDDEIVTMTFLRRFGHPISEVWAAITDAEARAKWFGPTTIDGCLGGAITADPDDPPVPAATKRVTGTILAWDPPRVFEHDWHQRLVEDGVIRFELVADGPATDVTVTLRGLGVHNAQGFIPGTHAYLDRIAALLDGAPIPSWTDRYAALEHLYRP
jgi:uncharacterized protein YndB with AHSA1/START domain